MTSNQQSTNISTTESTNRPTDTQIITADSTEHLQSRPFYAIINIDPIGLSDPIVITNKMATTDPRSVGPEPAIFTSKEAAIEQLARQEAGFGADHLRLISFMITNVFERVVLPLDD